MVSLTLIVAIAPLAARGESIPPYGYIGVTCLPPPSNQWGVNTWTNGVDQGETAVGPYTYHLWVDNSTATPYASSPNLLGSSLLGTCQGFCIDVFHNIYVSQPYNNFGVWNLSDAFASGSDIPTKIEKLWYVYNQSNNPDRGAALALALWEVTSVTSGTYDVTEGNFHVTGVSSDDTALANRWLDGLATDTEEDTNLYALIKPGVQSQCFTFTAPASSPSPPAVPEPTLAVDLLSLAAIGLPIGIVRLLGHRRRRASDVAN